MPTYEYKCKDNSHEYSEIRGMTEDQKATECPECGSKLIRIFTSPPIVFKSGFDSPF